MPRRKPTLASVLILLKKLGCWLGVVGRSVGGDVEDGGVGDGEDVVMMSNTVDVDVLEKEAARTLPGEVEAINVGGEEMGELA